PAHGHDLVVKASTVFPAALELLAVAVAISPPRTVTAINHGGRHGVKIQTKEKPGRREALGVVKLVHLGGHHGIDTQFLESTASGLGHSSAPVTLSVKRHHDPEPAPAAEPLEWTHADAGLGGALGQELLADAR